MFSKKNFLICGIAVILAGTIIILSGNIQGKRGVMNDTSVFSLVVIAPFQDAITFVTHAFKSVWKSYFDLVAVSEENRILKTELAEALGRAKKCEELEIANQRLRKYLNFREAIALPSIAAEVIGKDPSPWNNSFVINRGADDGVAKGDSVVVPEGVVGQVVEVSSGYSKIMLVIDRNSAVDALVQRSRARGIIKGNVDGRCRLEYAFRKQDIKEGDVIIASGLDRVYPKGISIGVVSSVTVKGPGVFQNIEVIPDVDYSRIEEVLVFLNSDSGETQE